MCLEVSILITILLDTSESGEKIYIKVTANHKQATVNGIKVLKKDVLAANGNIEQKKKKPDKQG